MALEIVIVVCFTVWVLFGNYIEAKAEMLKEQAREKSLENDIKEFGHVENNEEGS
jgi:hypothetical protein